MTILETSCEWQASGTTELYFYGELGPAERAAFNRHRILCSHCRVALEELAMIREALASRPEVTGPPSGDWSRFMARLDDAIGREATQAGSESIAVLSRARTATVRGGSYVPLLAMAALLALVTMSVLFVARSRDGAAGPLVEHVVDGDAAAGETPAGDMASLAAVSQEHLERSKLVLLGLANKDAERASGNDWTYERELASRLLSDTRLYRMAAEDRGLDTLAGVMRDLELVLLQTSMTEEADPAALSQIQRAIRKRDLLQKMDVVRISRGT